jgi:hypothetical protein
MAVLERALRPSGNPLGERHVANELERRAGARPCSSRRRRCPSTGPFHRRSDAGERERVNPHKDRLGDSEAQLFTQSGDLRRAWHSVSCSTAEIEVVGALKPAGLQRPAFASCAVYLVGSAAIASGGNWPCQGLHVRRTAKRSDRPPRIGKSPHAMRPHLGVAVDSVPSLAPVIGTEANVHAPVRAENHAAGWPLTIEPIRRNLSHGPPSLLETRCHKPSEGTRVHSISASRR